MSTLLLCAFAFYVAAGLAVAAAFVVKGVDQVSRPMTFTPGARLLLFPGAVALWPYVLTRWYRVRSAA